MTDAAASLLPCRQPAYSAELNVLVLYQDVPALEQDKKLSYRRGTARCVVSIEILPVATQQCRNYLYDKS